MHYAIINRFASLLISISSTAAINIFSTWNELNLMPSSRRCIQTWLVTRIYTNLRQMKSIIDQKLINELCWIKYEEDAQLLINRIAMITRLDLRCWSKSIIRHLHWNLQLITFTTFLHKNANDYQKSKKWTLLSELRWTLSN